MQLVVNGSAHEHGGDGTLLDLLREVGADPAHVATMVNNRIIRKEAREPTRLKDGDRVEIVKFVGGG